MKTRKSIQIATVAFALTMMAGYVSFSLRQARAQVSNVVAPGSKVQARLIQLPDGKQGQATNTSPANASVPPAVIRAGKPEAVAKEGRKATATNSSGQVLWPGSKSIVPLLEIQGSPALTRTNAPQPAPSRKMVFPGLKSAAVFDPIEIQSFLTLTNARVQ
jgi:hypothetical protein